jgi:hypothetical protein
MPPYGPFASRSSGSALRCAPVCAAFTSHSPRDAPTRSSSSPPTSIFNAPSAPPEGTSRRNQTPFLQALTRVPTESLNKPCPYRKPDPSDGRWRAERYCRSMRDLGRRIWSMLLVLLRSRAVLAAENLVLRQQINVLRRTAPKRPFLSNIDRLVLSASIRLFPGVRTSWQLSSRRRSCVGTVGGSGPTGAGDRGSAADDRRCRLRYAG